MNPTRLFIVVLAAITPMLTAAADELGIGAAHAACRDISDSLERLRCYDAISLDKSSLPQPAPAAPPAPTPAQQAAVAAPPAVAVDPDEFGKESMRTQSGPDKIEARVTNDFSGWTGSTVFELDNGQTWVQAGTEKYRYYGDPQPTVVIRRKAFGAYRLSIKGSNRTIRVRRKN